MKESSLFFIYVLTTCFSSAFAQDTIYKKDGAEIQAKVIEQTGEILKYKAYSNLDGPVHDIMLSDVFMIIYEDGKREVIQEHHDTNELSNIPERTKTLSNSNTGTTKIVIEDKREYKIVYGEMLTRAILVTGTRQKLKDRKNKVFPVVSNIFNDHLKQKGISNSDQDNPQYVLNIKVDKIYMNLNDKFTYVQVGTQIGTEITLTSTNDKKIVYSKHLESEFSGKRSTVISIIKQNGYKPGNTGAFFVIVIDDIIKQLLNDTEFQKFYRKT